MAHHAEGAPQDGAEQPGEEQECQAGATCRGGEPAFAEYQEQSRGQPDRPDLSFVSDQFEHRQPLGGHIRMVFSAALSLH